MDPAISVNSAALENPSSYSSLLRHCNNGMEGKRIHSIIICNKQTQDRFLNNHLVQMYGKCGDLMYARRIFESIIQKNVYSWTLMVTAYAQQGQTRHMFETFRRMQMQGVNPNMFTLSAILNTCAKYELAAEGKLLHSIVYESELESHVVVGTALMNMYGMCGIVDVARMLFKNLKNRDLMSWTAMLQAYSQHGYGIQALNLFTEMQQKGVKPDKVTLSLLLDACAVIGALASGRIIHKNVNASGLDLDKNVGTALINMYGKCGSLEEARKAFNKLNQMDSIAWTAMITTYAYHGQGDEAIQVFRLMCIEGLRPNDVTFLGVLKACSHGCLLGEGSHYFVSLAEQHRITLILDHYHSIVDLLGRIGQLDEAEDFLYQMPFACEVITFRSLLCACNIHGDVSRGKRFTEVIADLVPENASAYVLLSNIFAAGNLGEIE